MHKFCKKLHISVLTMFHFLMIAHRNAVAMNSFFLVPQFNNLLQLNSLKAYYIGIDTGNYFVLDVKK